MRLGLILILAFLLIASFVALVGYLYSVASDTVQFEIARLRQSSIAEVIGAAEMRLALQASQVAAQQIIAERYRVLAEPDHETGPMVELDESKDVAEEALEDFEKRLAEGWEATRAAARLEEERGDLARAAAARDSASSRLVELEKAFATHKTLMDRFIHLAQYHPSEQVSEFLLDELEPHYSETMLPLIRRYEKEAEGTLAAQLEAMESAHRAATRRNILVTIVAVLSAIGLGLAIARSISRPLGALQEAAQRVGQGDLESRIEIATRNEIGVLGAAFNQMVRDLKASTVSRSYLDDILQSMDEMLVVTDARGVIQTVNRVTLADLGFEEGELVGRRIGALVGDAASAELEPGEHLFVASDGARLPIHCSRSEMRSPAGELQGLVYVGRNISDRKRSEALLRASLEEKELLLKEVHHRVKNNLQIISSLLNLQGEAGDDPRADRLLRESRNRIRSMALIHEQLYQSEDLANIDFAAYAERLARSVVGSYGPDGLGVDLRLELEAESLKIDRAIPCGMILNELIANSIEHAFPDGRGEVAVGFVRVGDRYQLSVGDNGRGLPPDFDPVSSGSLGLRLVSALTGQLGGTLEHSSEKGSRIAISFPVRPAATGSRSSA